MASESESFIVEEEFEVTEQTEDVDPKGRSRGWVLTIWLHEEEQEFFNHDSPAVEYRVGGQEYTQSGKWHLQAYIFYKEAVSWMSMKKRFPKCSFRKQSKDATPKQAAVYCMKDGNFREIGTIPKAGKRTDIERAKAAFAEHGTMKSVLEVTDNLQAIRVMEIRMTYFEPQRDWRPTVYWFYGPSGKGKTYRVKQLCPAKNRFKAPRIGKWWDGYDGNKDVLIDDFRDYFMPLAELLQLFDDLEFRIEKKGGTRQFLARRIFVTTPLHPARYYDGTKENMLQLTRRIDFLVHVPLRDSATDVTTTPKADFDADPDNYVMPEIID